MQLRILTPIDYPATDRLSRVFNSYLYQLRSLERVLALHPSSMTAYAALAADDEANDTQDLAEMGGMLLHLATLSNSLNELAGCLVSSYVELDAFVSEGADFQRYAAQKRVEEARLHGYTDPLDVTLDGKTLRLRTEPEALAPFQLPVLLRPYFAGGQGVGEKIGTSHAVHFAYFSSLVANEIVFCLRDDDQPATPANLVTYPAANAAALGVVETETGPDSRFYEFDTSLRGQQLADEFTSLLKECQQAAAYYDALAPDDAVGFRQLLTLISTIMNGNESTESL